MPKRVFVIGLVLVYAVVAAAQVKVKGRVCDTNGRGIEYVSINVDSLFAISDAEGAFEMDVPKGHTAPMVFRHISYRSQEVPFDAYKSGCVNVDLEEDAYELPPLLVSNKKLKEKTVSYKGVKMPGDVAFNNISHTVYEIGPVISNKKDYIIKNLHFKVEECTYTNCTIRIVIYEISRGEYTPIQRNPIYMVFSDKSQFTEHTVEVKEEIMLKKGHRYYVGVAMVSSNGKGSIHFPAYLHSGYIRNSATGQTYKLPATLGISMKGVVW